MKINLTLFLFLFAMTIWGQSNTKTVCFKTTQYDEVPKTTRVKIDTILLDQPLDIEVYRKYFYTPYHYPKPLIHAIYKDTTVIEWHNPVEEKKFEMNWTYTTTYDRLSRAIKLEYSGCMICAQLPHTVRVSYDQANKPIEIELKQSIGYEIINNKLAKPNSTLYPEDDYYLQYDSKGDLIQVKYFQDGKLYRQIDKL